MKANSKPQPSNSAPIVKTESAPPIPAPPTALVAVDRELAGIPVRQKTALLALATGRSYADAARSAGVTRQTIHNWRTKDPRFAALINSVQFQAMASAQNRLLGLADDAITALGDAINTGETHAAIELLRRLGILVPLQIGSQDPAGTARDNKIAELEERSKALGREKLIRADIAMAKLLG